ncbi:MAG: hypothetical protein ACYC5G_01230 [Candidatus Doudnabacteria bacterium]
MIKIKRSFLLSTLKHNISEATFGDYEFRIAAGHPLDMFLHIYDSIVAGVDDAVFYSIYEKSYPIGYICIAKQTKEVFFYLSPEGRTRNNVTTLFDFIRKHLGSEFYTGTKKTNKRFVDFANKNGWVVWLEDERNVIYKATI